ncbi:MAG: hypothetical protein R3B47_08005 [Bacteroidia bacterium]
MNSMVRLMLTTLVLAVVSSACLEVTYETTIAADGSGNQRISLEMERLMTMLGPSIFDVETMTPEVFQEKFSEGFFGNVDSFPALMNSNMGISNYEMNFEEYSLTSTLDFATPNTLNEAPLGDFNMLNREMEIVQNGKSTRFSWNLNAEGIESMIMGDRQGAELDEHRKKMLAVFALLGDGYVTTIYHLPGKVKKVSDKKFVQVSKDKKP